MTWFKVDDNLAFHRKVVAAGNAAMGLWVRAGSMAAHGLSDGFVPESLADSLGTRVQIRRLVSAGLWHQVDGGYQFHDWTESQPTKEEVQEKRRSNAERQRAWRERNASRKNDDDPSDDVSNGVSNALRNGVSNAAPTRPDPIQKKTSSSSTPRKRGTRLPDDFTVTEAMVEWAHEKAPHVDGRRETEKFINHWTSASGQNATKIDWNAAWRNWMLIAAERNGHNGTRPLELVLDNWTPPTPPHEIADDPDAYRRWYTEQQAAHREGRA